MSGIYSHDSTEFKFNDLVVAEMIICPDDKRIGRLVQVRKGKGAFCSDIYIILLKDGSLQSLENVMLRMANDKKFEDIFYHSNGRTPPKVGDENDYPKDEPNIQYTIAGKYPEKGFIIENPKQPLSKKQSFGMAIISSE